MEKDIEEAKAKAEALKGEHAELKRQCDVVSQHCEELKQAQEQDAAEIAQLTEHRCQVFPASYVIGETCNTSIITLKTYGSRQGV